jgi:spore coat polysaccharide biosynthesis protein SpsF
MIIAILQARYSSSRLPGKVLAPILGKPMLAHQIDRVKKSQKIDRVIVATSNLAMDDPIANLCREMDIECFRGSLDDVLDRFYQAVVTHQPDLVVRLTGDCPLCDVRTIDRAIEFQIEGNYDYASNTIEPTFPDGLDVEVCRFTVLAEAHQQAVLPSHREHVTQFIHQQPDRYKLGNYRGQVDLSHLRWTVDERLDLELVTKIYESLYPTNPDFSTLDILTWLKQNPVWENYNTRYERNEGLLKSLAADREFLSEPIGGNLTNQP